jgi:hypothetical protein
MYMTTLNPAALYAVRRLNASEEVLQLQAKYTELRRQETFDASAFGVLLIKIHSLKAEIAQNLEGPGLAKAQNCVQLEAMKFIDTSTMSPVGRVLAQNRSEWLDCFATLSVDTESMKKKLTKLQEKIITRIGANLS